MTPIARSTWFGALFLVAACSGQNAPAPATQQTPADPRAESAENVRLVGYHDLQGRQSLVVTTKSDPANGNWVYVGHTPNDRNDPQASDDAAGNDEPILNPITGKMEWNGTSIVEISDPANPKLVWHIPNEEAHVNSRSVSVVYDYGFNSNPSGRDYLIRSWDTGKKFKFQIFDITSRDTDPSKISLVSEITGTPAGSCGPGCGGTFINRAHKGWWSQQSGLFYSSSGEPGFRGLTLIHIWDLKDPKNPKFVGRAWGPGQKMGEPGFEGRVRAPSDRRRAQPPALHRVPRRRACGQLGHQRSIEAEDGLAHRHEPPGPRTAHGVADHLHRGAELQRSRRPAADLCVHHR